MKDETVQTLHPTPGKSNKRISRKNYEVIREHILAILAQGEPTHTELMEALYSRLKDSFEGGVQWHGETVKLDLEARHLVVRTDSKPQKYRLAAP